MKRCIPFFIFMLLSSFHGFSDDTLSTSPVQSGNQEDTGEALSKIIGKAIEKGTRNPLKNTRIFIKDTDNNKMAGSVSTDAEGTFSLSLKPGNYLFIIAISGYDKFEKPIIVGGGISQKLLFRVIPQTINPYRVVVRQKKNTPEVSAQQLSVEEAVSIPGNNRDVLKSITNLPGANFVSVFNGYGNGLVIRGSSQEDSLCNLDDHYLPAFYHFGGFESIIEPEMIESVEYNAGGFSSEYGNAMGGVISMNIRNPRQDRIGGFINLGMLSSSAMVEGPISEKDSFYFSIKRGFMDQYMKIAEAVEEEENTQKSHDFIKYPVYYDTSFILNRKISPGNEIRLIGIGASDMFKYTDAENPVSERYSDTMDYRQDFFTLINEWKYKEGPFSSVFSPMLTITRLKWEQGERSYHKQNVDEFAISEKAQYNINGHHRIKGGVRLNYAKVKLDSLSLILEKEGEISYDDTSLELKLNKTFGFFIPAIFIMDRMTFGKLNITPGIHFFQDTYNEHSILDPRLSVKYRLTNKTALKTAGGLYSQMPQYDEFLEPWGTRGLKPERSIHTVAGIEHQFTEHLSLDVQAYNKTFFDLSVRDITDDPTHYSNDGKGRSYGVEMILRQTMTDKYFWWISYSYSVARRTDGDGKPERYFDGDTPHNLIGVFSYKPNRYWSFGSKYQYVSGTPYTDLYRVDTLYDVDNNEYIPQYDGLINKDRLPAHHQLDLRVDKYWLFDDFIISTYLDYRNVFRNKSVTSITYNEDYTAREQAVSVDSEVPLIFAGMKIDF